MGPIIFMTRIVRLSYSALKNSLRFDAIRIVTEGVDV